MSEVIAFIGRANVHVSLIWLCRYYAAGGINTHFEKTRKYRNATQVKATVDGEVTTMSLHRLMSERRIRESLSQLPEEQITVIAKVYMEHKSHQMVADELNIPLGTVKSRVRLALNKLKVILQDQNV